MNKNKRFITVMLVTLTLLLAACGGNNEVEPGKITVAGKDYTEQIIMTHLMAEYLEANTDLEVEVKQSLGSVFVLHEAMKQGDIDMYVEYTGTGYLNVLNKEYVPGTDSDEFYDVTKEGYADQFDINWLKPLGYSNQYALTLRSDQVEEFGIETSSELVDHAGDLMLGSTPEFYERGDGYDGMIEAYGFEFEDTTVIDDDLMYSALKEGDVDVITGYTTDPRIAEYDLYPLEDDLGYFPPYDAVPIISQAVLDANPGLEETINELAESGIFTDEKMVELNGRVNTDGERAGDVARDFLKENGFLE